MSKYPTYRDSDQYFSDLPHTEHEKRIKVFLSSFKIKLTDRKYVQEYIPLAAYMPFTNALPQAIESIQTKRVEYHQLEMPVSRFEDLVEVFYFNRTELEHLRKKAERLEQEEKLRENCPSLQKAYEQYQLILHMVKYQQ